MGRGHLAEKAEGKLDQRLLRPCKEISRVGGCHGDLYAFLYWLSADFGMVGKFYLFRAAIEGGFSGLAILGVVTSLVSAYYYLRVVVNMYFREGDPEIEREPWLTITTGLTAVATVLLSFVPQLLFLLASTAVLK